MSNLTAPLVSFENLESDFLPTWVAQFVRVSHTIPACAIAILQRSLEQTVKPVVLLNSVRRGAVLPQTAHLPSGIPFLTRWACGEKASRCLPVFEHGRGGLPRSDPPGRSRFRTLLINMMD